jgi:hypothetical protein
VRDLEDKMGERSSWSQEWIQKAEEYESEAVHAKEELARTKPKFDCVTWLYYSSMTVNAFSWHTLCQKIPDADDWRLQKMAKRLYDTLIALENTSAWSENYMKWKAYIKCWSEDFHARKMRSVVALRSAEVTVMSDSEAQPVEVVSTSAEAGALSASAAAVPSTSASGWLAEGEEDLPFSENQMSQRDVIVANGVDELLSKMKRTGGESRFWGQSRSSQYARAPLKGSVGTAELFLKHGDAYEVGGVIETPDEAWLLSPDAHVGKYCIYIKRMIQQNRLSRLEEQKTYGAA